jgi:PAS domain S-box-containing protein
VTHTSDAEPTDLAPDLPLDRPVGLTREEDRPDAPRQPRGDDVRIASFGTAELGIEARLRRLVESTPTAIVEFDAAGRIVYANAAAARILGRADGEPASREPRTADWRVSTVDGQPLPPAALPVARALAGETVVAFEHAIEDPATGERRLYSVNASPIREASGRVTGALSAFLELSDRHLGEAALAESEATYRLLAEAGMRLSAASLDERATLEVAAQMAVPALADWCLVDVREDDGTLRRVAVGHADPEATALAQRVRRSYSPEEPPPDAIARVLETGETQVVNAVDDALLAGRARDAQHFETLRALGLRAFVSVALAARERTLGVVTFATAGSGRRYGAREVALCEELTRRVALAYDNAALMRQAASARAEAEMANAAKSQFLATMSHEIRTPINAIQGYAQLIELGLAGPVTDPQRDYLARLNASSQHLLGLVTDVLDLARVDAGELRVARDTLLTGPAMIATLDLTRAQAAARGVSLAEPPAAELSVPFVGDEHRVRQILLNLLSNAVKFSDRGGTVWLRSGVADAPAGARVQGGPWAYVSVSDEGVGIPPHDVQRVFEPFHQVESGHTRTRGGTGLGLAISRRLARLMGGDVTLDTTPRRGSTFTLWLPTAGGARGAGGAAAAAHDGAQEEPATSVRGLAEIGLLLRERLDEIIETLGARLRADPALPHVPQMRRSELENHHLAFISDAAQTLLVLEDAVGREAELLRDSSTIQRVVAELHGRLRQKQGWALGALQREYAILAETMDATLRRVAAERPACTHARELIAGLVSRASEASGRALRHAADQAERDAATAKGRGG